MASVCLDDSDLLDDLECGSDADFSDEAEEDVAGENEFGAWAVDCIANACKDATSQFDEDRIRDVHEDDELDSAVETDIPSTIDSMAASVASTPCVDSLTGEDDDGGLVFEDEDRSMPLRSQANQLLVDTFFVALSSSSNAKVQAPAVAPVEEPIDRRAAYFARVRTETRQARSAVLTEAAQQIDSIMDSALLDFSRQQAAAEAADGQEQRRQQQEFLRALVQEEVLIQHAEEEERWAAEKDDDEARLRSIVEEQIRLLAEEDAAVEEVGRRLLAADAARESAWAEEQKRIMEEEQTSKASAEWVFAPWRWSEISVAKEATTPQLAAAAAPTIPVAVAAEAAVDHAAQWVGGVLSATVNQLAKAQSTQEALRSFIEKEQKEIQALKRRSDEARLRALVQEQMDVKVQDEVTAHQLAEALAQEEEISMVLEDPGETQMFVWKPSQADLDFAAKLKSSSFCSADVLREPSIAERTPKTPKTLQPSKSKRLVFGRVVRAPAEAEEPAPPGRQQGLSRHSSTSALMMDLGVEACSSASLSSARTLTPSSRSASVGALQLCKAARSNADPFSYSSKSNMGAPAPLSAKANPMQLRARDLHMNLGIQSWRNGVF